jgi:ATP-dependent DNA helicase Rep/DNA helicase-2/ATP-dependent DNA helicase PcrA
VKAIHYTEAAKDFDGIEKQLQAYNSRGSCIILAGPGSGKTKVITVKIARILHEDIRGPRGVACITYSNACVKELNDRLTRLGVAGHPNLLISTVHSFCLNHLVVPFGKLAGLQIPDPLRIASNQQASEIFDNACKECNAPRKHWFKLSCDRLRRTVLNRTTDEWREASSKLKSTIEAYERTLLASGLVDYDGLVLAGLELIERYQWVRQVIEAKFPIVVIDEYQDLGKPLHQMIVTLLERTNVRIIGVGDPNQSIYGFSGAKPELLTEISESRFVEKIELDRNFRSHAGIVATSNRILGIRGPGITTTNRIGEISIHKVPGGIAAQSAFALNGIIKGILIDNSTWTPGDIAFLYRSSNEGDIISQEAKKIGWNVFRADKGSIIKPSRIGTWLLEIARWCSGSNSSDDRGITALTREWRRLCLPFATDSQNDPFRKKFISTIFSNRNRGSSLLDWLSTIEKGFLAEIFEKGVDLKDEEAEFLTLLNDCKPGRPLSDFTVVFFSDYWRIQV